MRLSSMIELVDIQPLIVSQNKLVVGLIPDVEVISDCDAFRVSLDRGELDPSKRYVVMDGNAALRRRFRTIQPERVYETDLYSDALFKQFHVFQKLIPSQDDIAGRVLSRIDCDVIVVIVVDGLSYRDCMHYDGVEPCLVPGPTLTKEGYLRVIGSPTIGTLLAQRGFTSRLGFSYWSREDDPGITDRIFVPFLSTQMPQFRRFSDVVERIAKSRLRRTYIQITLQGLDYLAHKGSDEPILETYVERVFDRIRQIAEVIRQRGRHARIYMTADHGVLWKTQHRLEKIAEVSWASTDGVRYLSGMRARETVRCFTTHDGANYSLLKYPYTYRNLAPNEWGVHGGVSYEESIVPFFHQEV